MNRNEMQPTMSKPEAVWQAIEELGYRAPVSEILEYVRTRFGIDANTPNSLPEAAQEVTPLPKSMPTAAPAPSPTAANAPKPASQRKPRPRNESGK